MNSSEHFQSITQNAIDYLKKAIEELEPNPKYSIIHFYTVIELFFKRD